jgi:hypothetical protein
LVLSWRKAPALVSRNTAMTHIAILESLIGKVVDWMEHIADQQYRK